MPIIRFNTQIIGREVHQLRAIVLFLGLAFSSHFVAEIMLNQGNNGFTQPQEIEFKQLVNEGYGLNLLVSVRDVFPGEPIFFYGENECTLIPLFADRVSRRNGEHIQLSAQFPGLFSAPQIEKMFRKIERGDYPLIGMMAQPTAADSHLAALQQAYPDSKVENAFLKFGAKPNQQAFYGMILFHIMGFVITTAGAFWHCRKYKVPATTSKQLIVVAVGVALTVCGTWFRLTGNFDLGNQEELLVATVLAFAGGLGASLILVGLATILIRDAMFRANLLGNTCFETHRNVLRITKGKQVQEVTFEEVLAINFCLGMVSKNFKRTAPKFKLSVDTCTESIVVSGTLEPGQGPILQSQLEPLLSHLRDRYLEKIKDGEPVGTNDWTIDGDKLLLRVAKREIKEFRLNEISAFNLVGNHYALWLNNDDHRSAELGVKASNADVLHRVLNFFIETTHSSVQLPSDSPSEIDMERSRGSFGNLASSRFLSEKVREEKEKAKLFSLGRVLDEESRSHLNVWFVVLASLVAAGTLGYFVSPWIGVAIAVFGITLGVVGHLAEGSGKRIFRIHENGLSLVQRGKTTEILYSELVSFTYNVKHVYSNGAYVGDLVDFEAAKPDADGSYQMIKHKSAMNADKFQILYQKATRNIGLLLAEVLASEDRVEWFSGCYIYKDGVEIPVKTGFSKKKEKVGWERISNHRLQAGSLLMSVDGAKKWNVRLDSSKENFFPGYYLFENLLAIGKRPSNQVSESVSC